MTRIRIIGYLRLLPIIAVLGVSCALASGQTSQSSQTLPPPPPLTPSEQRNQSRPFSTLEEEMLAKRAINSADKAHKDNLNRARDLAALGASLADAFKEKNRLDREDLKKLEKAEKLAKNIRDAFGGSTEEELIEKPPTSLADAMTQLATLTESLKERVEKTPKRVVSAAVIDEANVLLELIRIVKKMHPKS
ncbi:MAG TPA: hypothetical protein VEW46_23770 [Pyrinomonadaceae bacterium]|nr:hypothetical protein [Pyrinomonadaceae bacterium]